MKRLSVFLILAIMINITLAMSLKQKRQVLDKASDDENENALSERYGWDRPRRPMRPSWNRGGRQWNQWQQPNQGDDQWEQPDQGENQWGQPDQGGNQSRPTPVPAQNGSTTQSTAVQDCIRRCPVTPEYNPVCGTDNVQYNNPGRLSCARACGVNVTLMRAAPCPATTAAAPAA